MQLLPPIYALVPINNVDMSPDCYTSGQNKRGEICTLCLRRLRIVIERLIVDR